MSLVFVVAQGRASIVDVDVELPIVFLADAGGGGAYRLVLGGSNGIRIQRVGKGMGRGNGRFDGKGG